MLDPLRTSIYLLVIVGIAAAASSGLIVPLSSSRCSFAKSVRSGRRFS